MTFEDALRRLAEKEPEKIDSRRAETISRGEAMNAELKPCPFCGCSAIEPIKTQVKCSNGKCPMSQILMHDTFWNTRILAVRSDVLSPEQRKLQEAFIARQLPMTGNNSWFVIAPNELRTLISQILAIPSDARHAYQEGEEEMTIQEAIKSGKPFMRNGIHPQWLSRCGYNNLMIGWCRKVHTDGKAGDWKYVDLDVDDILATDWKIKEKP